MQNKDDVINLDEDMPYPATCPLDNGCKFYERSENDMICNANRKIRRTKGCWRYIKLSKRANRP